MKKIFLACVFAVVTAIPAQAQMMGGGWRCTMRPIPTPYGVAMQRQCVSAPQFGGYGGGPGYGYGGFRQPNPNQPMFRVVPIGRPQCLVAPCR